LSLAVRSSDHDVAVVSGAHITVVAATERFVAAGIVVVLTASVSNTTEANRGIGADAVGLIVSEYANASADVVNSTIGLSIESTAIAIRLE
jgi:hypothetical protein